MTRSYGAQTQMHHAGNGYVHLTSTPQHVTQSMRESETSHVDITSLVLVCDGSLLQDINIAMDATVEEG